VGAQRDTDMADVHLLPYAAFQEDRDERDSESHDDEAYGIAHQA
jgi:hypothetical protein